MAGQEQKFKKVFTGKEQRDYVAKDQIWKDHCNQEKVFTRHWDNTWGFMAQSYDQVIKDELPNLRDPNRQKVRLPDHMLVAPVTPVSSYIHIEPSPKPVPRTTSREIGWRSSEASLALDKYGRDARSRGTLIKQLNWPTEALP